MKLHTKIILAVSVLGVGVLLYWWLTRDKTSAAYIATPVNPTPWAVSDMLQVNQISTLSTQVQEKTSRDEVKRLIVEAAPPVIAPAVLQLSTAPLSPTEVTSAGVGTLGAFLKTLSDTGSSNTRAIEGNGRAITANTTAIAENATAIAANKAALLTAYIRTPVANYASALTQAIGSQCRIFVVAEDESDNNRKNRYWYEGVPGTIDLIF